MAAKLVSKREPLICLEPFKFMRRQYDVGDIIDRRMVKMLHRRMTKYIESGHLALCRDMEADELEAFGYVYDVRIGRYPLVKIADMAENTVKQEFNPDELLATEDASELSPEEESTEEVETENIIEEGDELSDDPTAKHAGGGWYDIMVNGETVNQKSLRPDDIDEFIRDYYKHK